MENIDKTMKFDYDEIPKENVQTVLKRTSNSRRTRLQCCKSNCWLFTFRDPAYIPRQMMHVIKYDILIEM